MDALALVDCGGTNIGSVKYALERLGVAAQLTSDAAVIRAASHVILPGVGAAAPGMARLRELALVDVVRELTQPVLGVCLGMQLLFEYSEEGDTHCLGILPGSLRKLPADTLARVPHIGWNALHIEHRGALLDGIDEGAFAYFVHSYAAPLGPHTLASTHHGASFASVVQQGNFFGAQFHPERSASVGARLLQNFVRL